MAQQPLIHFDYDFSPYGQKTKLLLTAAGVSFSKCDQPMVLPRPDLEALGITYRRIPLLAIGKDIYADSSLMIDTIMSKLAKSGAVATSAADKPFEDWGNATFQGVLGIINPAMLSPDFVKDRATIFPVIERPDYASLRPSSLAAFQSRCRQVEDVFLKDATDSKPFMGGDKLSLADIHIVWTLRWALTALGAEKEKGCGKESFPKMWKMIESLPEAKPTVLSSEDALSKIRESEYSAGDMKVAKDDPLADLEGKPVVVESADAVPGKHPQYGKLVAADADQVVLEVGNDGIRLHFPRVGYVFKPQQ